MEGFDCVIVGAGVIGLAIARTVALSGRSVLVVEQADQIGTGNSSRNSEVIHAGIHYAPRSLKARLCVEGRDRLYAYCRERDIAHARLGKLVVAVEESQLARLEQVLENARASDVDDLKVLSRTEAVSLEPNLHCVAALLSPSTGIMDAAALMRALRDEAEQAGALFVFRTMVREGAVTGEGISLITVDGSGEPFEIGAGALVNAAGLGAQALAAAIDGFPRAAIPPLSLARGCYFSLSGRSPFSRLVYPIPVDGGLGVHLTLDLGGAARFGPDVEWIDSVDYTVDPRRADKFYAEIRRYWPGLADDALRPSYAGVRPKLSGPGEPAADFMIQGPGDHGAGPIVNLFGMESPGLTSSLAAAELVRDKLYG